MVTNPRGDVRTLPDPIALKTRGLRTTYVREIVVGVPTRLQIGVNSRELETPDEESLTEWTTTGRGKIRSRPDPLAMITKGVKTTYEQRDKGALMINIPKPSSEISLDLDNDNTIELEDK